MAAAQVDTHSVERDAMGEDWQLIADVRAGLNAVRKGGEKYLPRYEAEDKAEYDRRAKSAPWRPVFVDILSGLVSKPFARDVKLAGEGQPQDMKDFAENVDQRGSSITTFARGVFENAVADGWTILLTDYPVLPQVKSKAEEKAQGGRPYWVNIRAHDVLALYTGFVGGVEAVEHIRFRTTRLARDGYTERLVEQIRVLEPGRWETWEKEKIGWVKVGEGQILRGGKTDVPMAFLWTGTRLGTMQVKPPLIDIAQMQIEHYQAGSRKDEVLSHSGAPMLAIIGLPQPDEPLKIGPRKCLYVPPGEGNASVQYLSPDPAIIQQVRDEVDAIADEMRRLGMQPMTQQAGALSATATSVDAAKSHSVLQAWAGLLKDALEQALVHVAEYYGMNPSAEITVHTDFIAGLGADPGLAELGSARRAGDISQKTYWQELERRAVLGPQFDAEREAELLAEEAAPLDGEQPIDPVTGKPITDPQP